MTKDEAARRWQRVEELFRGAVELPEDERTEFLDAATGDDPELRREVDELLEADKEADDFITGAVRAGEELLTQSVEVLPPKFGKYEVESRLGEGGFGVVYRGRDPMLDRPVAIKACSSTDAGMRKRFYREARIAAGLRHPNITTVHELGVEEGIPFIVQELLEGEDLRQIVGEERRLPLATAVSYLLQIARGLEHAHGAGVLHRDVKPANVRIQPDGSVKLMDFGIAKILGADTGLTGTGMTLGTVGYLAPEQLRSEEVDERADIFAFGVLAYELLGQRRPFVGDDFSQVSYQLLYVEPPPLEERWPGCPPPLAKLVHRCLHKDKLQRPGSMAPVRRVLEDLHRSSEGQAGPWIETDGGSGPTPEGSGTSGPRSTTRPMASSTASKRWAWVVAAGVAGLAVMLGLFGGRGLTRPADDPEPGAETIMASVTEDPSSPEVPATWTSEEDGGKKDSGEEASGKGDGGEPADDEPSPSSMEPPLGDGAQPPAGTGPPPLDAAPRQPSGNETSPPSVPSPSLERPVEPSTDGGSPARLPAHADGDDSEEPDEMVEEAEPVPSMTPGETVDAPSAQADEVPAQPSPSAAEPAPGDPERDDSRPNDRGMSATEESALPAMRRGDMITDHGPGVVPPKLLQRPQPDYPPRARRRGIEQQVVVKVLVDEDGGVVQVIAPGSDTHGFLAAARNAAREARFEPARRDGIEGRMWVNLNFDFTLD